MKTRAPLALLALALVTAACQSTEPAGPLAAGVELQAYPAGLIATGTTSWGLDERRELRLHAGWNETDREDWGEHDDETGGGPGLGFSARHYFGEDHAGWFLGARADLWFLEIDWVRNPSTRGSSDVVVLQPTLLGGYRWKLADSGWDIELTAAGGAEINVDTSGEDVGEGAIGLVGLSLRYGF